MNKIVYIVCFLIFTTSIISGQEEIRFMEGSLAAALSIAKEREKNLFIDTYADWCKPCKRMDIVFKNRDVAMFYNEHFINLKVNMQNSVKANELRRKYDVVFLPTMIIVDPNGVVKYQVDKELSASEMLNIGQIMLDPNSYNISDATAVRRNDGTMAATRPSTNVSPPPSNTRREGTTTTPPTSATPSTSPPAKVQETAVATPEIKESTPTTKAEPSKSTSEATKRAQYLDGFETVDESKDKILYVLGEGEMPPSEILMQEAYFRLELMDGSHKQSVKDYLASQQNWNTPDNRKFILDFVASSNSAMYDFLVKNKTSFIDQFGNDRVQKTLEIITYKTLHTQVPRPTLEEAITMYQNLDVKEPVRMANNYYINRLIAEEDFLQVVEFSKNYFSKYQDHATMHTVASYLITVGELDNQYFDYAIDIMRKATNLKSDMVMYYDLLGDLLLENGNDKKAIKAFQKAAEISAAQGLDSSEYERKSRLISEN